MPRIQDFRSKLHTLLAQAEADGASRIEINSRQLHEEVGGYPPQSNRTHRMPTCCQALYGEMKLGDQLITAPPKGKGATVTIRFKLPR